LRGRNGELSALLRIFQGGLITFVEHAMNTTPQQPSSQPNDPANPEPEQPESPPHETPDNAPMPGMKDAPETGNE